MRKIFCAVLMMFVMCSVSFGASEDMSVYVRQDVFDAKMETLLTRIEGKIDALSERIDGVEKSLSERIDGLEKKMDARFEGVEKRMDVMDKRIDDGFNGMNKRIDEGLSGVNKRIDDTHNFLYLILVLLGVMLAVPFINKYWDFHKEHRTPAVTLEDVKRLITEAIAENNAKIRA